MATDIGEALLKIVQIGLNEGKVVKVWAAGLDAVVIESIETDEDAELVMLKLRFGDEGEHYLAPSSITAVRISEPVEGMPIA